LQKRRLLAITKADLIDDELESLLRQDLPTDVETIFISAATNQNLQRLKDSLWRIMSAPF
ncbi:MAG: GTPase ObgE, partial [Chitinophagales bacterium]|nr:GTPase ObgE [Chitinophagales bacterium]